MKCELCGCGIMSDKIVEGEQLCHECYCKVHDLKIYKPKTVFISALFVLLGAIAIFSTSQPDSASSFIGGWLIILVAGFIVAGVIVTELLNKVIKGQIKHPYIISLLATGILGAIAWGKLIFEGTSLESAIGFFILRICIVVSSVMAGIILGKLISLRNNNMHNQKNAPDQKAVR